MATRWQENYQVYKKYLQSIANMYRSRSDIKMFTELVLTLLSIVIFSIFAIRPTALTIAGLVKEISQKKQTIQVLDKKISDLNQAQVLYENEKERINILKESVPNVAEPENFVRQMEGLANKHSVLLNGLTVGKVVLIGQPQEEEALTPQTSVEELSIDASLMDVSVSATGTYSSLVSFMKDVESLQRPIYLDSTSLALTEGDNQEELVLTLKGRMAFTKNE